MGDGIQYPTHSQHQCPTYESMGDTANARLEAGFNNHTADTAADSVPLQSVRIDAANNEEPISVVIDNSKSAKTIVS